MDEAYNTGGTGNITGANGCGLGSDGMSTGRWSVERRFRVTEVFLAVLWVCGCVPSLQRLFGGMDEQEGPELRIRAVHIAGSS